ncbi:MAG TPA: RNA-binding protein [Pseudogracilibacillus sp.]|nr:RNA-binding protein [Pseudogracilibacillus sp.]
MSIYQHFRQHEHMFVDQVLSWKNQVETTYTSYITDFLDPRERHILSSLIGQNNEELQFASYGGVEDAERKRMIIAPFYEELEDEAFDIVLLEASFPQKFVTIQHRDILGTLLSQGIDRKKIGDIFVQDDKFQFITTNELSTFLKMNITKIKNASVQLKEVPFTQLITSNDEWQENTTFVSSLRLDVIVKEIYRMSRKNAVQYIASDRVKVNFTNITDQAMPVEVGDLISVRGHGRSKVLSIDGLTKKERLRITTAKLKMT